MAEDLKIKIGVTADTAGAKQAEQAIDKVASTTKKATAASKEAAGTIDQFGQRGSAAKDAFEGLSQAANGGAGSIFNLSKAWKNLTVAFAANPITAALAVILGLLPLIQKGFEKIVDIAQKSLVEAFAKVGKQTEALKKTQSEQAAAAKTSLQEQIDKLGELSAGYDDLIGLTERASARAKAVRAAEKDVALSKATSDQEKEKINTDFARREIKEDSGDAAFIKAQTEKFQKEAIDRLIDANREVQIKTKASNEAKEAAKGLGARSDDEALELRRKAAEAENNRKLAEQNQVEVKKKVDSELKRTDIIIDRATTTLDVSPLKAQAVENNERKRQQVALDESKKAATEKLSPLEARRSELIDTARAAGERGDFASVDQANADRSKVDQEIAKLKTELKQKTEAQKKADADTKKAVQDVTETVQQTEAPKPIDPTPIIDSFAAFGGKLEVMQTANAQAIKSVSGAVDNLGRRVDQLTRLVENALKK